MSKTAVITAAALLAFAPPALAATPPELSDLIGARGAGGETQLLARGYVNTGGEKTSNASWTYWWNGGSKTCVGVVTSDGRYQRIDKLDADRCGKGGGSNTGAVVAGVAVAALLGAAIAAHHDKHHDDEKHYDGDRDAQYERGFQDGVHDGQFLNYDHDADYSSGYAAGQRERDNRLGSSRYAYGEGRRDGWRGDVMAACAREADRRWDLPPGATRAMSASALNNGRMYLVSLKAGYKSGTCEVTDQGSVVFVSK
ncbi:hypothetical protein P7B02_17420 [Caulobacter segnis]|uniref:hypothetical protein n=1 Tax=Caulobacter segnis TaxID=88688 RepID=UPI0024100E1D|nr:hypothetical protein [Caulobacter segnis]MDG2523313.1 hypothetical protein [Caulobacter segnis]